MKLISIGDGRGKNAMVGIAPFYRKIEKEEIIKEQVQPYHIVL